MSTTYENYTLTINLINNDENNLIAEPTLYFGSMTASEKVGRPFQYKMRLLTIDSGSMASPTFLSDKQWNALLGASLSLSMLVESNNAAGPRRFFCGVIESVNCVGQYLSTGQMIYEVTVVPPVALMKYTNNCRVFTGLSVPAIIKKMLEYAGIASNGGYTSSLVDADYQLREMVVQFNESDFDFIHRLMEEEGIAYYFIHSSSGCCMKLFDHHSNIPSVTKVGDSSSLTVTDTVSFRRSQNWLSSNVGVWSHQHQRHMNTISMKGSYYSYRNEASLKNTTSRTVDSSSPDYASNDSFTWMNSYQYPTGHLYYDTTNQVSQWNGDTINQVGSYAQNLDSGYVRDQGNHRLMSAGYSFTLASFMNKAEDLDYRIIETEFVLGTTEFPTPTDFSDYPNYVYDANFMINTKSILKTQDYAPPRITPKPQIQGIHTARVVYASNTETLVDTDSYGSVYVKFHWAKSQFAVGSNNPNQYSVRLRVSQYWAGKLRGALYTPRFNDEVFIAFINGDPDRPVIIGSAYNSTNTPFIDPSEYPLVSGIRSRVATSANNDVGQDYKSINHTDFLIDDQYDSSSTGMVLRSFMNSAGHGKHNYKFDSSPIAEEDTVGIAIINKHTDEPDLKLMIACGDDVTTTYKGNQDGVMNIIKGKQIKSQIGKVVSFKLDPYQVSSLGAFVKSRAIYYQSHKTLFCSFGMGPRDCKLHSWLGEVKISSGLPVQKGSNTREVLTTGISDVKALLDIVKWGMVFMKMDDEMSASDTVKMVGLGFDAADLILSFSAIFIKSFYTGSSVKYASSLSANLDEVKISTSHLKRETETKIQILQDQMNLTAKKKGTGKANTLYTAELVETKVAEDGDGDYGKLSLTDDSVITDVSGTSKIEVYPLNMTLGVDSSASMITLSSDTANMQADGGNSSVWVSKDIGKMEVGSTSVLLKPSSFGIKQDNGSISIGAASMDIEFKGSTSLGLTNANLGIKATAISLNNLPNPLAMKQQVAMDITQAKLALKQEITKVQLASKESDTKLAMKIKQAELTQEKHELELNKVGLLVNTLMKNE